MSFFIQYNKDKSILIYITYKLIKLIKLKNI